jgi:hypothetical protein
LGIAATAVVVASLATLGVVTACAKTSKTAATAPAAPSTTVKKRVVVSRPLCPLTGLPAPFGVVPARSALMVKVGNEPGHARPQSGLDEADVVFDTPAESFIMRYIAVYQCQSAAAVGPTRSVRWVDYQIAPQFGNPILAFAGGIGPNVQAVAATPGVLGANLLTAQSGAAYRTTDRRAPDNLYTSTSALWALPGALPRPPRPIFTYTPRLPVGALPLASAELYFSQGTDVVWQWQPATRAWLHTYSGAADIDTLTQQPVTATNVVIEVAPFTTGPYAECTGCSGDIQSSTTGSGAGYVLRDGNYLPIRWSRPAVTAPTRLTTMQGQPVGLAPGRTWVEIITGTQAFGGIHLTP